MIALMKTLLTFLGSLLLALYCITSSQAQIQPIPWQEDFSGQKIDMEFVRDVTMPSANKVWIDLVGLYFDPALSSEEVAVETPAFNFFPNPAQDYIWVQTQQAGRLQVWNLSGHLLKTEQALPGGNVLVPVADLPAGVYLVRFDHAGGQVVKKLVKQ